MFLKKKRCENCGKTEVPIKVFLKDKYGEKQNYYFCSYSCLTKFALDEYKKEGPKDDRFITGKEK